MSVQNPVIILVVGIILVVAFAGNSSHEQIRYIENYYNGKLLHIGTCIL